LQEQAQAYVRFALDQPARFTLMFSNDVYDRNNPQLQEVAHRAYEVLEAAVRDARARPLFQALDAQSHGLLLGTWSIVHGFAHLALAGELRDPQGQPASREVILTTLLPAATEHLLASIRR
jgi:Tetracyclin repressor-like, C-terminal domain